MSRPSHRRLRWQGAARLLPALVLVLTGCRVDGEVRVVVDPAGSGTVVVSATLDGEAASRLGDGATVATDDLAASGWSVRRIEGREGELTVRASKRFGSPAGLPAVLAEVGGAGDAGVFRGWRLTVEDGFASTARKVSGRVVLTGSLDQFGDTDLAAALDGLAVGYTPEELAALVGSDGEAVRLDVVVEVPGAAPRSERFTPADGQALDRRVAVEVTQRDGTALRWFLLAVVTAALGVVVVGLRLLRPARPARPERPERPEAPRPTPPDGPA